MKMVFCLALVTSLGFIPGCGGDPITGPVSPITQNETTAVTTRPGFGNYQNGEGLAGYVEALNKIAGRGKSLADNAAVPLMEAIGPKPNGKIVSTSIFHQLGIESIPEPEACFHRIDPTKSAEAVRAALHSNRAPLALVSEGVRRQSFYMPLPAGAESLARIQLAHLGQCRAISNAICLRAQHHLEAGRATQSLEDIATVFRLGRHVSRHPFMIGWLIGLRIEQDAISAALQWLQKVRLTKRQHHEFHDVLESLPARGWSGTSINLELRATYQRAAGLILAGEGHAIQETFGWETALTKWTDTLRTLNRIRKDVLIEEGQLFLDKLVAAHAKPPEARIAAVRELLDQAEVVRPIPKDEMVACLRGNGDASAMVARLILTSWKPIIHDIEAPTRVEQQFRLMQIAAALMESRETHRRFPKRLELLGAFIETLPVDVFSADAAYPKFIRMGDNYILYSVGVNGLDEKGRGDDIAMYLTL